ncbi:MAG TPA: galactokinase family protein, partial [Marmoricola sp.]|nr:galactokinase family protein [Marmoricola sp.]
MSVSRAIAAAPGRINLIGEHLDYNGGRCLPMAIPLRTFATVSLADGGEHRMHSSLDSPGWQAYPLGVLRALEIRMPLSIEIESELPSGAGLSSSAALLCSVATAIDALLGLGLSTEQL